MKETLFKFLGQVYVITLVEQEDDTRAFSLIDTWIRPDRIRSDDVAVYLTTSFNFSGFDVSKKVVGFFDFRSLLWQAEELTFTHESCFEPELKISFLTKTYKIPIFENWLRKILKFSISLEISDFWGKILHFFTPIFS